MTTLSVKEQLGFGWRTFKARPWIFVKAAIVLMLIGMAFNVVSSIVSTPLTSNPDPFTLIIFGVLWLAVVVASMYVSITVNNMGYLSFYLKAHDAPETVTLRDLYRPHPFWKYVLASFLLSLMVLIGIILLVIPGIIVAVALFPALYLVLDKGMEPIPAIKEAARLTKGKRWKLFQLTLALFAINILGTVALLVGLLVSIPVSMLACIHAYRTLVQEASASVPAPSQAGS